LIYNTYRRKGTFPLSVFLIIDDRFYELMFSLTFICRNFPSIMLEVHVVKSRLDAMKTRIYPEY
jgi:hypothetical protein